MTLHQVSVAVAIDVGGTGIKCAIVDESGKVLHTERHPTGASRGPEAVVRTIIDVAEGLATHARAHEMNPVAAGVVVPAIVDDGVAVWSANLGLRDVPLRDLVADRLGLPTALGHDVRAGALAEARLGAGRSTRRMLFVAIGTGIAGGFVVDGRIDSGAHGAAGEIGHVVIRTGSDALPCSCGGRGCLEIHASAAAIARAYAAVLIGDPSSTENVNRGPLLSPPPAPAPAPAPPPAPGLALGADEVARRVAAGERAAVAVWGDAVDALADGLLVGIALHDPDVIVLGGGLAEAEDILLDPLRSSLQRRKTFHRLPRLATADLGDGAGCQGAAILALELVGTAP